MWDQAASIRRASFSRCHKFLSVERSMLRERGAVALITSNYEKAQRLPMSQRDIKLNGEDFMKKKSLSVALIAMALMFFNNEAEAQSKEKTPRVEVGVHFISLHLHEFQEGPGGAGLRFTYNINDQVSLEAEANHFPENPSGNFGESLALVGLKAGKRNDTFGIFGKVRPGVIRFDGDFFSRRLDKHTFLAVNVSGALEYYPTRRLSLRFELGDMIIAYRGTKYLSTSGPEIVKLGTSHNLQTTIGLGVRF